jgi:hypothetical protein
MKPPTAAQLAALFLAEGDSYIRPASPTHARRCATSVNRLGNTVQACQRLGWLAPISEGRYVLTDAGREFVPGTPVPARDEARF